MTLTLQVPGACTSVRELLDLNRLIEDLDSLRHASLAEAPVPAYDLALDLPLIQGNYRQIRRLLAYLLGVDSGAGGARNGMISLETRLVQADRDYLDNDFPELPEGKYALVHVSDSDCGGQAQIIEPLFSKKYTARGLGLAAALGIVWAHRGGMAVTNEPGFATIFKVLLPCKAADKPRLDSCESYEWIQRRPARTESNGRREHGASVSRFT